MIGNVIYIVREITEAERNLIPHFLPTALLNKIATHYRHYGIEIGDGSVVQFTGTDLTSPLDYCVIRTSLWEFLEGRKKHVDIVIRPQYERETIAMRALERLGDNFGGYNLFRNNCEHFAYWCATGKRISRQAFFIKDDQSVIGKITDNLLEPLKVSMVKEVTDINSQRFN